MEKSNESDNNSFEDVSAPLIRHWAVGTYLYQRDGLHYQTGINPRDLEYLPSKLKLNKNTMGNVLGLEQRIHQPKELDLASRPTPSRYQQFDMRNLSYDPSRIVHIVGKIPLRYIENACGRLKGRKGNLLLPVNILQLNGDWMNCWVRIPGQFVGEDTLMFCGLELQAANAILHNFYSTTSHVRRSKDKEFTQYVYVSEFQIQIKAYLLQQANRQNQQTPSVYWDDQLRCMGFTEKACKDILLEAKRKLDRVTFNRRFFWIAPMAISYALDRFFFLQLIHRRLSIFTRTTKWPDCHWEYDYEMLGQTARKLFEQGDLFYQTFPVAQDARLPSTFESQPNDTEWSFLRSPFTTPQAENITIPVIQTIPPMHDVSGPIETEEDAFNRYIQISEDSP
jgi:hypothetical protein